MTKRIVLLFIFNIFVLNIYAISIDEEELKSIGNKSVQFVNYDGPRTGKVDTIEEVINIGRAIGTQVDLEEQGHFYYGIKYSVVHSYQPDVETGLDADIFILHENSRVDHIRNLRYIIAGYLEDAYGYSFDDAMILAEFVTYYNAVYYQNINFFQSKYKPGVLSNISGENAGISTHYSNWPGKTRMIIPLRGIPSKGSLSSIDTSSLTNEDVINEMRQEDDKKIDERKDMTELREKELQEEQLKIDEKKEEIKQKEETVDQELKDLEDKEKQQGLTVQEEEKKQELLDEKEKIEEEKQNIAEDQKELDERTDEVLVMRDDIAEDENKIFENESKTDELAVFEKEPPVQPAFFHKIDDPGNGIPYGRILKIDLLTGKILKESPITSIRGDTILIGGGTIAAISGKSGGGGSVKFVFLDTENMEIIRESGETVYPGSFLTTQNSRYYMVIEKDDYYIGCYDSNMLLVATGDEPVRPDTSFMFDGGKLIVQGKNDSIIIVNAADLKKAE